MSGETCSVDFNNLLYQLRDLQDKLIYTRSRFPSYGNPNAWESFINGHEIISSIKARIYYDHLKSVWLNIHHKCDPINQKDVAVLRSIGEWINGSTVLWLIAILDSSGFKDCIEDKYNTNAGKFQEGIYRRWFIHFWMFKELRNILVHDGKYQKGKPLERTIKKENGEKYTHDDITDLLFSYYKEHYKIEFPDVTQEPGKFYFEVVTISKMIEDMIEYVKAVQADIQATQ